MPEKLRIAVIGTGVWGSNILKTLYAMPDVEIAWTAGRDWVEKLKRPLVNGVTIAVPARAQAHIARAVLNAGVPIFIEKPMALTVADAKSIHNRALMMGDLPVVVDHVHLFSPEYEVLSAELVGKTILSLKTAGGNWGPFRAGPHAALWDYGPHEAAFALDLIGVPDKVSSIGADYNVQLDWNDGVWAKLSFGNTFRQKTRALTVEAEDGTRKLNSMAAPGARLTRNGVPVPVDSTIPPLEKALSVWLDAIRGEVRDERVGCAMGIKVTELLTRMIPTEL